MSVVDDGSLDQLASLMAVRQPEPECCVLDGEIVQTGVVKGFDHGHGLVLHGQSLTDGGTVVYAGDGAVDIAVQPTETGVRVQTVIADASAPAEYSYEFDGVLPTVNADGSVDLNVAVSDDLLAAAGHLEAPWAVDANGQPVPTSYRVEGSTVVQMVVLDASTRIRRGGFVRGRGPAFVSDRA